MLNSKQIMERGRDALKGKWNKLAIFELIVGIIVLIPYYILDVNKFVKTPVIPDPSKGIEGDLSTLPAFLLFGFIIAVLRLVFFNAISIGKAKVFINLVDNGEFNWKLLKHGLHKLGRNVLSIFLATFFAAGVFGFIAGAITGVSVFMGTLLGYVSETAGIVFFAIGGIILAILAGLALYKFFPTYAMLYVALTLDDQTSATAAIKDTYYTITPYNKEFCCLSFRFTGWLLLSIVTFGIAFLWVGPYMATSYYVFYKECIADQENYSEDSALTEASEVT